MLDHLNKRDIERYYEQSLSEAELVSVCRHLEECESCREKIGGQDRLRHAFIALDSDLEETGELEPFHLSAEHIAAYVNGNIGDLDAEIVHSHLDDCLACAGEVRDLRSFEFPAASQLQPRLPERSILWREPASVRRSPAHRISIQIASLAAVALLLAATLLLLNQVRYLNARVTQLEKVSDTLRQQEISLSVLQDEIRQLRQAQDQSRTAPQEISSALNDGGNSVFLDRSGKAAGLSPLRRRYQQVVKNLLATGRTSVPKNIYDLIGKPESIMGAGNDRDGFHLRGPVGTVVVGDRPVFRWDAAESARAYIVDVFDSASNKVATSGEIHLTQWSPLRPLKRDRVYSWEVTAVDGDKEMISPAPPAPQARFKILDQASVRDLLRAKKMYATSHLVLGGIYAEAGLLDEAELEFTALLSANPNSPVARNLLESVKSLRGRQ